MIVDISNGNKNVNETDSLSDNELYQNRLKKILEKEFIGASKIFVCERLK